jgi:hypothetical protein
MVDSRLGRVGRENELDGRDVTDQHRNSDCDVQPTSQHHTLGPGETQSSPGSHIHDGTNSRYILEGVTLTGAKAGNTALASVVAALVLLGATDSTT